MAKGSTSPLRALCASVLLGAAPQFAAAEAPALDLSALRAALRGVEAEFAQQPQTPVDVAALWEKLPVHNAPEPEDAEKATSAGHASAPTLAPVAPAAKTLFGQPPVGAKPAAQSVLSPGVSNPSTPGPAGGLFSMQLAETTTPQPALKPLPAPTFETKSAVQALQPATGAAPTASAQAGGGTFQVDGSNFRLMLAALSQTYTGRNSMAVVNAQGPRGAQAISVRSGTVTLAQVQAQAAALGMPPLADGTLTAPLVIWPEATLRLSQGERLALARDTGAFLLAMGTLDITGATIEAVGPENPHTPSFVPFVTVAGGGTFTAKGAIFRGLGFGQTAKFSGVSVAGNLLNQNKGKVEIRNSLFDGIKRVSIAGTTGAKITGNTFINPGDSTLHLINAAHVEVDNNLFLDGSHTNAMRIESGSIHTKVTRNIFLSGQRVAMLISGRSDHAEVRDNLIWKRAGAGIKLLQTRCGLVQDNIILDNLQKGVEVRKSDGTVLRGNVIAGNRNAGIWVSAQTREAQTALNANVLVANGAGLSAATGAEIFLSRNDFGNQLPKLLDGDIARLSREVVTNLDGAQPLRFNRGAVDHTTLNAPLCGSAL